MNEHNTYAEPLNCPVAFLTPDQRRAAKRTRKFVRKVIRADLQRRAITGEPSPFRRHVPEAHQ